MASLLFLISYTLFMQGCKAKLSVILLQKIIESSLGRHLINTFLFLPLDGAQTLFYKPNIPQRC